MDGEQTKSAQIDQNILDWQLIVANCLFMRFPCLRRPKSGQNQDAMEVLSLIKGTCFWWIVVADQEMITLHRILWPSFESDDQTKRGGGD